MKNRICQLVESKRALYADLCDKIWAEPERNFQEFKAAKLLTGKSAGSATGGENA